MKKRHFIPIIISAVMIMLNVLARSSRSFSDFYVTKLYPVLTNIFSFISGLFPFSVGEIMIILAILLILIGLPLTLILLIFRKKSRKKTASIASAVILWVCAYIVTTETMNCFIMYQCTPFSERYFVSADHTDEELTELYSTLIDKANELAEQVPRDGENRFILTCDVDSESKAAMKRASADFPQVSGYYPDAKPIMFSYFMSQSHLSGIYFPFSFESNYNDDMLDIDIPSTMCHEYAHLKGIIQEDEANFIAFIATTGSDNPEIQYSGYIEALEYVHNEIYNNNITSAYPLTDKISDKVLNDWFSFLPDNYWEENKDKEIISTETVSAVSSAALDANIRFNGRNDGIKSYSRVVNLLLDYYFSERKK